MSNRRASSEHAFPTRGCGAARTAAFLPAGRGDIILYNLRDNVNPTTRSLLGASLSGAPRRLIMKGMARRRRKRDGIVQTDGDRARGRDWFAPFMWGVLAAGSGMVIANSLASRRRRGFPLRLIRGSRSDVPPVVVIPGIMGSRLMRPDGTPVWLNIRNAVGHYDLSLPLTLPLAESRDDLVPGPLLGTT